MKKEITILLILFSSLFNVFASVSPNILINGYLGEELPPSLILKVDSTEVEDNGAVVAIIDNFNFSTETSSLNSPILAYAGYTTTNNSQFNLTVTTDGFKQKDISGTLIGSALDVDIQMHTETLDLNLGWISEGFNTLPDYTSNIFLDLASSPATFIYALVPNVNIADPNYKIWFTWEEKTNIPAGSYGAIIGFAITTI